MSECDHVRRISFVAETDIYGRRANILMMILCNRTKHNIILFKYAHTSNTQFALINIIYSNVVFKIISFASWRLTHTETLRTLKIYCYWCNIFVAQLELTLQIYYNALHIQIHCLEISFARVANVPPQIFCAFTNITNKSPNIDKRMSQQ